MLLLVCWAYYYTNRVQVPVCAELGGSISEWQGCCGRLQIWRKP